VAHHIEQLGLLLRLALEVDEIDHMHVDQRGAQLMGDAGEEVGLQLVQELEPGVGLRERLGLAAFGL
jgi:hypothetical protein